MRDEIATSLAAAAAAGDEVAARVLLQATLGGLVGLCAGGGFAGPHRQQMDGALDAMVSTVWLALVSGDALGGHAPVRKRLLRDAEYVVLQRPRRRRAREAAAVGRVGPCGGVEVAGDRAAHDRCDITGRAADRPLSAAEELMEVVRDALARGLDVADARLICVLGVAGAAVRELAGAEQVTARAVRYRRAAALRRIRALTGQAA
jgi:hypothetical protein